MAEKNMCNVCGSGNGYCGECGNMCGYRGNNLLRWLLGIIIITWIFSMGVRFGEMKAYLEQAGYDRGHVKMYSASPMMGMSVMKDAAFTVSSTATPSAGAVKAGTVQIIQGN